MQTAKQGRVQVEINWMIRRHMAEVLEIERETFEFCWSEEEFVCVLGQRNATGMVAEHADRVVGFMVYELTKRGIHVLNFAVAPGCRRRGVGAAMAAKLVERLSVRRRGRITLEVRETNLAAQLFWHAQGFRAVAILRGYYDDSDEDAYGFTYRLLASAKGERVTG